MKKIITASLCAFSLLTSSAMAYDMDSMNANQNGKSGYYAGVSVGASSGTISLETSTSSYTFTDSDAISTTDFKAYAGKGAFYLFVQTGSVAIDTAYKADDTYTAFGIGYQGEAEKMAMKINDAMTLVPRGDFELGLDSADNSSGILVSFDVGLALKTNTGVALTANVGYDIHALKDDTTVYGQDATWNYKALTFDVGASIAF